MGPNNADPLVPVTNAPTVNDVKKQVPQQGNAPSNQQRLSKEEIAQARTHIKEAFELAGLVDDHGNAICPKCGKSGRNRMRFFPGGGYQCYSSEWCNAGDNQAVTLLVDRGWKFTDAALALLGRPHGHKTEESVRSVLNEVNGFRAEVDSEVYEAVIACGSKQAAADYYARWHISAESVAELGTSVILDVPKMKETLTKKFGKDRLVEAGLVRPGEGDRRDYWVINKHYPVLEPHRNSEGRVVGLQARASADREARYKKHLAYSAQKKAAEAKGETFRDPNADERYVGKFSSLRGGQPGKHLVGGGLDRLAKLEVGTTVYIVEGIKDMLAMRTLGFEAYALPGVGVAPPPEAMRFLARCNVQLCFDADDGGDTGTEKLSLELAKYGIVFNELGMQWHKANPETAPEGLLKQFLDAEKVEAAAADWAMKVVAGRRERGLRCLRKRPPEGMDVTDVLVDKHTKNGCNCKKR